MKKTDECHLFNVLKNCINTEIEIDPTYLLTDDTEELKQQDRNDQRKMQLLILRDEYERLNQECANLIMAINEKKKERSELVEELVQVEAKTKTTRKLSLE